MHVPRVTEHWLQQLPLLPHPPADPDPEDLLAEGGGADLHDPGEVGELGRQIVQVGVDLFVLSVSLQGAAGVTLSPVLRVLSHSGCEGTPAKQVIVTPGTSSDAGEMGLTTVGEGELTRGPSCSAA